MGPVSSFFATTRDFLLRRNVLIAPQFPIRLRRSSSLQAQIDIFFALIAPLFSLVCATVLEAPGSDSTQIVFFPISVFRFRDTRLSGRRRSARTSANDISQICRPSREGWRPTVDRPQKYDSPPRSSDGFVCSSGIRLSPATSLLDLAPGE